MPITRPSLTPERRRLLRLLASSQRGVHEELLVHGHGHSRRALAGLLRAKLAAAEREMVMADGEVIEVIRIRITTAGRKAIES